MLIGFFIGFFSSIFALVLLIVFCAFVIGGRQSTLEDEELQKFRDDVARNSFTATDVTPPPERVPRGVGHMHPSVNRVMGRAS